MRNPAVSVIIPMYNAERYVGESLESVLLQTFQDFEVIVVDDCSTDNSVKIVESYLPKFDGRLRLLSTEKNTGGGGMPRNKGIEIARGEYIQFLDADDFMLLNALEVLYSAAKKYNVDVVYSAAHYLMKNPNDVITLKDVKGKKMLEAGLKDNLALTVNAPEKNLSTLLVEGNFHTPWTAFVRREFLIENKLFFPNIHSGEDFLWIIKVYSCVKRFLRHPVPLHFYRNYNEGSITQKKRSPQEQLSHWISVFVTWTKHFSKLVNETDILKRNSAYCYQALKSEFDWCRFRSRESLPPLKNREIYEILQLKFAHEEDLYLLAVPFFCTLTEATKNARLAHLQMISDLRKEIKQLKSPVSVVVSMHNAEEFIGECLDSLLAQTFQDFEVIVVDDCSTDNSVKIVKEYASKFSEKLTLTKTENHSGNDNVLRNVGLRLAHGKYVFFIDAKDVIDKTALDTLYKAAKENNADVVYTSQYNLLNNSKEKLLKRDGTSKKLRNAGDKDKTTLILDAPDKLLRDVLLKNQHCTAWTKFIRRELLTGNEIDFPEVIGGEELWTLLVCANAKRFLRLPETIYFLRPRSELQTSTADFVTWFKTFRGIASKIPFLKENPMLCRQAAKVYFDSLAFNTAASHEVRKLLLSEETDNLTETFCLLLEPPTLDNKADDSKVELAPLASAYGVSVVVPLYNCERYIGECLDSLLAQTFKNFEVIVVDDCSTDDGVDIVENYQEKFGGRLRLTKTSSNSGGSGVPRNKGLFFCRGEYVFFMNADGKLTPSGLETMYNAAKKFDADTVHCEKYFVSSGVEVREVDSKLQEPMLETNDLPQRIDNTLNQKYELMPWLRLVSRRLLIENNINFSHGSSNVGWAFAVLVYSKRFLRLPNACYVKRTHSAAGDVHKWLNQTICGLKDIDDFMGGLDFFKNNPRYRYDLLNFFYKDGIGTPIKAKR